MAFWKRVSTFLQARIAQDLVGGHHKDGKKGEDMDSVPRWKLWAIFHRWRGVGGHVEKDGV